jgi:hypothetical protein
MGALHFVPPIFPPLSFGYWMKKVVPDLGLVLRVAFQKSLWPPRMDMERMMVATEDK